MNAPRFTVPDKWGLCFAGNEPFFCSALDVAVMESVRNGAFNYVEIGLGFGDCMRAVDAYLANFGFLYTLNGVDIETCNPQALSNQSDRANIWLMGSEAFLKTTKDPINFIFIDGCHGAPCVTRDFLLAEPLVARGGVVAFHDTDPGCQDIHPQPHCGSGIRARKAVKDLGLLGGTRDGWRVLEETTGNKDLGGHGCLFVQKQ